MGITEHETADGLTAQISGPLTLQIASDLRDWLKHAFEAGVPTCLDLTGVEDIDLACLQLLLSSRRSFSGRGIRFQINDPGDVWAKAASAAGFPEGECSDD